VGRNRGLKVAWTSGCFKGEGVEEGGMTVGAGPGLSDATRVIGHERSTCRGVN